MKQPKKKAAKKSIRVKRSLVKDEDLIRTYLIERFIERGVSHADVVKRANKDGFKITEPSLCNYLKRGNVKSSASEESIVYLCKEYDIELHLIVKKLPLLKK